MPPSASTWPPSKRAGALAEFSKGSCPATTRLGRARRRGADLIRRAPGPGHRRPPPGRSFSTPPGPALFDEFAAACVRGDQPDLAAYVRRAGDDGDELARLIDVFLRVAPAPEPREDDVAVMHARLQGEPGLLALRRRRARKVDDVVADLAERLRVDDVPRLKRYYQRLEGGTLDPRPVDERVWEALRELFVTNVRAIVRPLTTRTGESAMAYYRRGGKPSAEILASAAPSVETQELLVTRDTSPGERDELDRLFLGDD